MHHVTLFTPARAAVAALLFAASILAAQDATPRPQAPQLSRRVAAGTGGGFITFAVNVHDWRLAGDSADTLLRLIGIFGKHGVRGDFYLTAPIVQRYVEERPEVIARLQQTGMTISYHVRAPHPLWRGFSDPVRDKGGAELAAVLRDYESFQLDLTTGGLNRSEPGGYRYVEKVFGRRPVAVGTSDAPPQIRTVSNRMYAELGVQVAVFHHETGTKPDQPFEWHDGLLARPSDFSVTRFEAPGSAQGIFWWNMAGTPRAAEFDPVALLQKQLAAWSGGRPPFITALIHENDFYRQGGPGWNAIYFDGDGPQAKPRRAPFDLATPVRSQPRPAAAREAIFAKYEELVAYAAQHLSVITSEDIAAMAKSSPMRPPRPAGAAGNPSPPFAAKAGPPAPPFEGVFVRIPSSAAGSAGLAASVRLPRQPRFADGAPVVISVPGGVQAGSARGRPEYTGHGFIEIHFAFPGGGEGAERSGGRYDFRGPDCLRALADVIRFATGRLATADGRRIDEVARGVKVLTRNAGLVGASHGGNACGMALALHGGEFADLAWYASMESPYGEGAANVELGGRESGLNPAYDPKTGALDLSSLKWSPELSPGLLRRPMLVNPRELRGALFFDLDRDGRFSADKDFPVHGFVGDAGQGSGVKAWYSPRIIAEAERRELLPGDRPGHVPTLADAKEFWRYRDATAGIPAAVRQCPQLAVIVYANERDHVQADPAHTHILEQVEGFRRAGARFVRLNPDRAYVERVVSSGPAANRTGQFADNPAGQAWTRANIAGGVEPAAFPPGIYMQAAVGELADRTQAGAWAANLEAVLFPGAPRPPAFPPGGRPPAQP